jgi:hypothetical protein
LPFSLRSQRSHRPIVTIIGSDNSGNVEGLTAFLAAGWPVVRRMHADAELRIFGQLANKALPAKA